MDCRRLGLILAAWAVLPSTAFATSYTITNTFTSATTAVASEVNANFSAAKTAIDENSLRLDSILNSNTCNSGPCDLTASTTIGGSLALTAGMLGVTVQAYDADLADLADGSLSGSKVGTGLDITTATTGTLALARMHSGATQDTEWDTAAEINAATTDDDFVTTTGTHDLEITGYAIFSGTLQGLVATTIVSATTHAPTASALRGGLFQCTNASGCDVTLPTAVSGYNACWYDNNGGGVITIDAAAGDVIILDGVPQPTAEAIDSAGARGDFICILALDATNWVTLGRSGTFIAGGAD